MDRRAFLSATGAAVAAPMLSAPMLATPTRAFATPADKIDFYYGRLKSRLGDAGGGRFLAPAEDALLPQHNEFRASEGLHALVRHEGLDAAARAHAADLADRNYFEHASPEGYSSTERVALLARRFVGLAGENIVELRGGPPAHADQMAELWRNSPGHRTNMLRPAYTHVGFGVVRVGDRTIGATAFGERFAELEAPLAYRVGDGSAIGAMLQGSRPTLMGYALSPIGGGEVVGPYWVEDPPQAPATPGVYTVTPYIADKAMRGRFIIVNGPMVEAG